MPISEMFIKVSEVSEEPDTQAQLLMKCKNT